MVRAHGMRPMAAEQRTAAAVPFALTSVLAGFPSPAEDYLDRPLDFNEILVTHPSATFAVRIVGDSMTGAGIHAGDIAVVNRALTATDGSVILAVLDGEFTVKRYRNRNGRTWLEAANETYKDIPLTEDREFQVWGVIKNSIRVL